MQESEDAQMNQSALDGFCEDRRDGQFFGSSRGTVSFAVSAFAADPHAGRDNCSLNCFSMYRAG